MGGICSTRTKRNKASKYNKERLVDEAHSHANESEARSEVTNGYPDKSIRAVAAEVISEIRPELHTPEGSSIKQSDIDDYKTTFTLYYARLCDALGAPIVEILPELESIGVITVPETEEILSERNSLTKAKALLKHIFNGINTGCPKVLDNLLSVMWHCSDHTCKGLSKEICLKLNISPAKNQSRELSHIPL